MGSRQGRHQEGSKGQGGPFPFRSTYFYLFTHLCISLIEFVASAEPDALEVLTLMNPGVILQQYTGDG